MPQKFMLLCAFACSIVVLVIMLYCLYIRVWQWTEPCTIKLYGK